MAIFSSGGVISEGTDTASGFTSSGHYWGSDAKNDTLGVFRTPLLTSSASAAGSSNFLTVYSSGHWGCQPLFDLYHITQYYRPHICAWRCCFDYNTLIVQPLWEGGSAGTNTVGGFLISGSPKIKIHNDAGSSQTVTHNSGNIATASYTNLVGHNTHAGQPVNKVNIGFETAGPYYQSYMIIKLRQGGGGRCFFSDSTVSNVDNNQRNDGPGLHFKTIPRQTDYYHDNAA